MLGGECLEWKTEKGMRWEERHFVAGGNKGLELGVDSWEEIMLIRNENVIFLKNDFNHQLILVANV